MSGGGVQIFSMGIVFMLLLQPFKNLASVNTGTYIQHFLSEYSNVCSVSIRAIFPNAVAGEFLIDIALAKACLSRVQCSYLGPWSMEMSCNGFTTDGYGGLVGV